MKPLPDPLIPLIEPAIYAVRQGTPSEVRVVLSELDAARQEIHALDDVFHPSSYAAGALASLREVLNTSLHRAGLNAVIDGVRSAQRGLDVLRAAGRAVVLGKKLSQKALATQIGMDEGNFSRLAKRLQYIGALEMRREGASSYLQPTTAGEAALDEMLAGWRAAAPADEEDRPKIQLNEPFRTPSKQLRTEAFGKSAAPGGSHFEAMTPGNRRLNQILEQTDTAATA